MNSRMQGRGLRELARLSTSLLDSALSGLIVLLMIAIVLQVVCSALDINPLASFEASYFLVGKAITLNSLLDFQWHLLVIVGLIPAGLVWLRDGHVRVDFISVTYSNRRRALMNLVGNIVFAAPFLLLTIPATWDFARRAYRSGESGTSGGLTNLWVIKGVLFVGLCLLAVAVVIETVRLAREVLKWKS